MNPPNKWDKGSIRNLGSSELLRLLSHADDDVLLAALENPNCETIHILQILRNPRISERTVKRILSRSEWMGHYKIKAGLVNCRVTPVHEAMRLIDELFWFDLARISLNFRIDPRLRRKAERRILNQFEELAVGERMTLARMASRYLLTQFRTIENHPKVLISLLKNPRLVEEDLLVMLSRPALPVEFIRSLAAMPQWALRESVRLSLLRHPHTPIHVAMQIARYMTRGQLRQVINDPRVRTTIKQNIRHRFKL